MLTTLTLETREHGIYFYLFKPSLTYLINFFVVFTLQVFHIFCQTEYFIFLDAILIDFQV